MANTFGYSRDTGPWEDDRVVGELLKVAPVLANGDVDLRPFCTDTNQYALSACAGNASADAVEIVSAVAEALKAKAENRAPVPVPQLSRLFVYAQARTLDGTLGKDEGTFIRSCFESLSRFGIPEETVWPYLDEKVYVSPSIIAQRAARGHTIHSYYRIKATGQDRLDEIVAALQTMHPVVFGTLVDSSFMSNTGSSVINRPGNVTMGGHAMIVVGYINNLFLVKNSWGSGWRDGGYALFTPDYMTWDETWDLWVPTLGYEALPRV